MKNINIMFDEEDYEKLIQKKDGLSWREFILTLIEEETD